MVYVYLYQDKENKNCRGEIRARTRNDAYLALRKQGIRPYRVIGDDPWNWRPWAIWSGYGVLLAAIVTLVVMLAARATTPNAAGKPVVTLTEEEAEQFRARAEEAVYRAPEAYRYNVWKGVNARLAERGLAPIEKPEGLVEDTY